jgi:hypothetical protein
MTSKTPTVVVALLRQPRSHDMNEMRSDPFWEFGSFGLTGCHKTNLMHPRRIGELAGARVAFVQGGDAGFKLVYLTPPVTPTPYADRSQINWQPDPAMPFRYERAPVVIAPDGRTDLPLLLPIFKDVRRSGWMGRFASKFRTRREPLSPAQARQMIDVWTSWNGAADPGHFAHIYTDALPYSPPKTDFGRRETYDRLLARALGTATT